MNIVLFGMQGSGKGTQARMLIEKNNYQTFETGSVLRKIAASGSEVGNKVKERIEHGKLVDTDLIMD
ncbi:MAG: nucleoside monophosphate kinase, partial [Patescibacteria group bacterium]|nr:nucleoside monophosphate kinase [Patescibacteria group bacterium]